MFNNFTRLLAIIVLLLYFSQTATASPKDDKCYDKKNKHNSCQEGKQSDDDYEGDSHNDYSHQNSGHKVKICHKPNGATPQTLNIDYNTLATHLNHGDYEGKCQPKAYMIDPLRFGTLIAPSAGKVTINPINQHRTSFGDIVLLNDNYHPAKFTVELHKNETIFVTKPSQIAIGQGRQNLIIDNITSHITYANMGRAREATIYIGGDLNLGATNPAGTYEGIFDIDISVND